MPEDTHSSGVIIQAFLRKTKKHRRRNDLNDLNRGPSVYVCEVISSGPRCSVMRCYSCNHSCGKVMVVGEPACFGIKTNAEFELPLEGTFV